jgi:hypothetical protein
MPSLPYQNKENGLKTTVLDIKFKNGSNEHKNVPQSST